MPEAVASGRVLHGPALPGQGIAPPPMGAILKQTGRRGETVTAKSGPPAPTRYSPYGSTNSNSPVAREVAWDRKGAGDP